MPTNIIAEIKHYKSQLVSEVNLNSISKRAPVAYKWVCLYQSWNIRELVMHRLFDLLEGAEVNQKEYSHIVSVLLVRASIETVSLLVRLNTLSEQVTNEQLDFFKFNHELNALIFGSRTDDTPYTSKNTVTLVEKADKKYKGLMKSFESLCEKAHPNYSGLMDAYSKHHEKGTYTLFEQQYSAKDTDYDLIRRIIEIFRQEYDAWDENYDNLIRWLEDNDEKLEALRNKRIEGLQ